MVKMNKGKLFAAAMAGILAGGGLTACGTAKTNAAAPAMAGEKNSCSGAAGADGEKNSCQAKTEATPEAGEKAGCNGKDGCS